MATIRRLAEPTLVHLLPEMLVGRAEECELRLNQPFVSATHARLAWRQSGIWQVQDLGSRNGTFVDGRQLAPGERATLRQGQQLAIGQLDQAFLVVSDEAPEPMAYNLDSDEVVAAEQALLTLGKAEAGAQVYQIDAGSWVVELAGEQHPVEDGEVLEVSDERWRLCLVPRAPTETATTAEPGSLPDSMGGGRFEFTVSADEEHVRLKVLGLPDHIESDRAFVHLLMTLARARASDGERTDLPGLEMGWRYADEIADQLGYLDMGRINVDIFRARQDLARQGLPDASRIVERRRGTGQLRLGTGNLIVRKARIGKPRD